MAETDFPFISEIVPVQPGATLYIRNQFPTILDFIQNYYEWLEQNQSATQLGVIQGIFELLAQRDIDSTLAQFLPYFFYEYLNNIPNTILADPRKLAKHIKDFYLARGSEGSYKLLFQILYSDPIQFYYPKNDLFIADGGIWSVDTIIRTTTNNNTYEFIGRKITGVTSGATAYVEQVVQYQIESNLVSEIYISGLVGIFSIGEYVNVTLPNNRTVQETTYGLATGILLTNPGTAYQPDDIIMATGLNTTTIFSVDVINGTEIGRVVQATFENDPQPPAIQLASSASMVDGYYNNMEITITDGNGNGQTKKIINYIGENQVAIIDSNWIILPDITSHYSISLGNIQTIKVNDFGIGYTTPIAANFSLSGNGDATGTIMVGAVGHYAGRFVNDSSFIDYKKYLEDDYYYQAFSYVVKSHETLEQYENVVKKLLHPAGLALFGEVILENVPFVRKSHEISGLATTAGFSGLLPSGVEAQYSMMEDLTNSQLLYDDSSAYPNGYNGYLGSTPNIDIDDPNWGTTGVEFLNTFITDTSLMPNNLEQTIVVVAKINELVSNSCFIGSIDTTNDSGISGYQIFINSDGSISFRTQKINPSQNNLVIKYPAGSINTSDYFFASLRYLNNTIVANLNQQLPISGSFGFNIDATSVLNNSHGYYFGIGGYHPSYDPMSPLYAESLFKRVIPGIPGSLILPATILPGYFNGIISYAIIWNRYLSDQEISNAYQFIRPIMIGRGVPLY
jgi:hypothetical protein